jgi:hypothetical protein
MAQYGYEQKPSCNDLVSYAKKNYDSEDSPMIISSTMLAKVERYTIDDSSLVIAYIKKDEYDLYGKPYVFCGISDERWTAFKNSGLYDSWGKSFHKYIIDYTCDCE